MVFLKVYVAWSSRLLKHEGFDEVHLILSYPLCCRSVIKGAGGVRLVCMNALWMFCKYCALLCESGMLPMWAVFSIHSICVERPSRARENTSSSLYLECFHWLLQKKYNWKIQQESHSDSPMWHKAELRSRSRSRSRVESVILIWLRVGKI